MNDINEELTQSDTDSLATSNQRGASLVEYALLVALIAVVCVAAVAALGGTTTVPYSDITSGITQ